MDDGGTPCDALAADDVLAFWFGGDDLDTPSAACMRRWFGATPQDDAEIRARFGALHARAAAGLLGEWASTPRGRLALIVTLDQLSRHIHRGTARAFAADAAALRLCREGLARGDDRALPPLGRAFFYMPLHHAEDVVAQEESVRCFERLAAAAPAALALALDGFLEYAREHAETVRRFGRFPHRNATLARDPTAAEEAYLAGGASSYGQSSAPETRPSGAAATREGERR